MTREEIIASLKGIFPPVVTPFNRRGGVDEGGFRANQERYAASDLSGVVVAGSTGETPYLTERERLRLVEIARDQLRASQVLIVGTGLESTQETIRLSREAIERGADALLVLPPHYYRPKMDSRVLTAHYRALADGVRRPVLIYSIPQFTGIRMEPELLGTLSRHPNIAGMKESSGDVTYLRAILRKVRPSFRAMAGLAAVLLESLRVGAVGGILAQANFIPELCIGVYDAFSRNQMKAARVLQEGLAQSSEKVTLAYGIPGIKLACDLCGYTGGVPRSPLLPLDAASRRAVAVAIKELRNGLEY